MINKRMQVTGFLLLESLVYLVCCLLLFSLTAAVTSGLYTSLVEHLHKIHTSIDCLLGVEQLIRSVQKAPSDYAHKFLWKKPEAQALIFSGSSGIDHGWSLRNKKLTYAQGIYNTISGKWQNKKVSIASIGIQMLVFNYKPRLITCNITGPKPLETISACIFLRESVRL